MRKRLDFCTTLNSFILLKVATRRTMYGVGKTWLTCQWLVKLMTRAILCNNWIFSSFVVNHLHVSCFCCFTPHWHKDPLSGKVDRASLLESRRLRVMQSHTAVAISELSFSTLSPGL